MVRAVSNGVDSDRGISLLGSDTFVGAGGISENRKRNVCVSEREPVQTDFTKTAFSSVCVRLRVFARARLNVRACVIVFMRACMCVCMSVCMRRMR